jgi:hypothetical protein
MSKETKKSIKEIVMMLAVILCVEFVLSFFFHTAMFTEGFCVFL